MTRPAWTAASCPLAQRGAARTSLTLQTVPLSSETWPCCAGSGRPCAGRGPLLRPTAAPARTLRAARSGEGGPRAGERRNENGGQVAGALALAALAEAGLSCANMGTSRVHAPLCCLAGHSRSALPRCPLKGRAAVAHLLREGLGPMGCRRCVPQAHDSRQLRARARPCRGQAAALLLQEHVKHLVLVLLLWLGQVVHVLLRCLQWRLGRGRGEGAEEGKWQGRLEHISWGGTQARVPSTRRSSLCKPLDATTPKSGLQQCSGCLPLLHQHPPAWPAAPAPRRGPWSLPPPALGAAGPWTQPAETAASC